MRHFGFVFLAIAGTASLAAQSAQQAPPQSARQALIEMFTGKRADDFQKHLPDAARKTLIHKDESAETSIALKVSSIVRELSAQGGHLETFDAGPDILVSEEPDGHERTEVAVEQDSLVGEEEQIELSVHIYKDSVAQPLPVVPRIIFTMKQEKEVWRLTELTVAAHVPLTDPDYLAGLRKQQNESNESAAMGRMQVTAQMEIAYMSNHPETGYTCTLSNLFPQAETTENSYANNMTKEESNGYRYALTGCDGTPASKYQLTAMPSDPDSDMKTLCIDESGKLRIASGSGKSNCFSRGEVINTVRAPVVPE